MCVCIMIKKPLATLLEKYSNAVWGWEHGTGAVLFAALKGYQAGAAPPATGAEVTPVLRNT